MRGHRLLIAAAALLVPAASAGAQPGPCTQMADAARIVPIGAFTNLRQAGEHAYGDTVMLWRAGDCVFGLFEWVGGLAGDSPLGAIQNVSYDPRTGALAFAARLTTGTVSGRGEGPQPSRDLVTFRGEVDRSRVIGSVAQTEQSRPDARPEWRRVVLGASRERAEQMGGPETYGEWRAAWEPILARRGPKW
jgi:hypothetical protein